MSGPEDHDAAAPPEPTRAASPGFRLGNVLMLLVPLALLVVGAFVFVAYFNGLERLSTLVNPPLVTVQGRVLYRGEPLRDAQISTRYGNGKMTGAIGWTDDDGRFALQTDIDGYVEGAYAGEHQVVVTAFETLNAPAAPPLRTPAEYASFDSTPLKIVVSRNPQENSFEFKLEGDPPQRPARNRGGPPLRPPGDSDNPPADAESAPVETEDAPAETAGAPADTDGEA